MLYLSLVVSGLLLLITNLFAWKSKQPVSKILVTSFLFALLAGIIVVCLPPVLLQAALLAVIAPVWGIKHWRRSLFLPLSCVATLLVYTVLSFFAYQGARRWQEEFPYKSIEDRLPLATTRRPAEPLPPATLDRLTSFETLLEERDQVNHHRAYSLRMLHEETVGLFVAQPQFGFARMPMVFVFLRMGVRDRPPIPQPGKSYSPSGPPDSLWNPLETEVVLPGLLSLHRDSLVDFVNREAFGFVKDRRHVAGFQEHQMSAVPNAPQPWTLQTLDLIGLVVHDKPTAYVSDHLPRMDELRVAPTRPLDDFEAAGLPALERGEELYVRDRGPERRMLGAVRATRQCLACHGGERGDLFGAFSYRLTRGVMAGR